jgi:chemotaxis regulatin CheY-phosphate phosphatase CheZ
MSTETVSHNIERLVDHLRENSDSQITLGDVASVTEVLLSIMRRYFNTIDISIYGELREMSQHISKAREEIAELRPKDLKEERIPRAGKELEAIVQATEAATGTIMDAAEEIMNVDGSDPDADQQVVTDACMRIFEACSFQDITGQRITKVVSTLTYIEDRLSSLQTIWGPDVADKEIDIGEDDAEYERAHLLKGPSLEGEGIDQTEVDAVLAAAGSDAPPDAATTANGSDSPAEDQQPECAEAEASEIPPADKAENDEEPRANGKPAAKKSGANGAAAEIDDAVMVSGEEVSQADIDALFD